MPKAYLSCLALAALLLAPGVSAQPAPSFPPGALAMETTLRAKVGPQTRSWIRQLATRQIHGNTLSEDAVRRAMTADPVFADLTEKDIDAVVFLVMMQAARLANDDLREVMQGLDRINASRTALRATVQANAAAATPSPDDAAGAARPARLTRLQLATLRSPQALPAEEFGRRLAASRDSDEALSEMAEMETLRLQMAVDRMSKTMQTLSNLLKKLQDTQKGVLRNLK